MLNLLILIWCKPRNPIDEKAKTNGKKIHLGSRIRPILKKPNLAIIIRRERKNSSFLA
jgi:hypothetical protein